LPECTKSMSAKPRRYRLAPLAEADLEDIWLYTLNNWSLDQADKYYAQLMAAVEGLASGDRIGRNAGDIRAGYWKYGEGRHFIFYMLADDRLDVIRVLHKQMDVAAKFEG
jgi:toxin ParE1/3/4